MYSLAKCTVMTFLLSLILMTGSVSAQVTGKGFRQAAARSNDAAPRWNVNAIDYQDVVPGWNPNADYQGVPTKWNVNIVDHPDVSDRFGDLHLSGNTAQMRKFFENIDVQVRPDCPEDKRTVDSFFDVFTETSARSVEISLECSCCPLRCKLTIRVNW